MTAFAEWLNTFFYAYDAAILTALHSLAEACGGFFTPFFALITLLGEKGIIFFLAAAVMMLFKRTRRIGVCLFGAVCCGALITNICLKASGSSSARLPRTDSHSRRVTLPLLLRVLSRLHYALVRNISPLPPLGSFSWASRETTSWRITPLTSFAQ